MLLPKVPTGRLLREFIDHTGRGNLMSYRTATTTQAGYAISRVARNGAGLRRNCHGLLASLGFGALLLVSVPALAATAPNLGSESTYGIVSETYTNTVIGTTVNGTAGQPAVCYTTPPGVAPIITGTTVTPCPPVTGTDQATALANLNSQACTPIGAAVALNAIIIGSNPPGTFPPGCYSSTGAMSVTTGTTVTLNGSGVYIFRSGGSLDPAANSNVVMAAGGCQSDVFWAPTGGTTIGANSNFVGNVFRGTAAGLSITLGQSTNLVGRALAFGSTVTTDTNAITVPTCAAFVPLPPGTSIPTLSEWTMILLAALMAITGFIAMRRKGR